LGGATEVTRVEKRTGWGLTKADVFRQAVPVSQLIVRERLGPSNVEVDVLRRLGVALAQALVMWSCVPGESRAYRVPGVVEL
jgi:hypothetical protein